MSADLPPEVTRSGRSRRALRSLGQSLALFAPTALGVLLAFRVEEWRADRSREAAARATMANFSREIALNRAEVIRHRPYHAGVATRLQPLVQQVFRAGHGPLRLDSLIARTGFDGTQPPEFQTAAWDLALATQSLSYLDQGLAFRLAVVYKQQASVERFADQYLQSILNTNTIAAPDVSPAVLAMENYFRQTAREEDALLVRYDSLSAQLRSPTGTP